MEWLNYHHLLYFWTVARTGSIAKAARELRLAQPTISGQLRTLEAQLGEKLFVRRGRHLVLTETGKIAYGYADDIFGLGRELLSTVKGRSGGHAVTLRVGVTDVLPKLIGYKLLVPATRTDPPMKIVCREGKAEHLVNELASHELDIVLTDAPVRAQRGVRAFDHLLGECGTTFFGTPELVASHAPDFPRSLDRAPLLVPTDNTNHRRALDAWFESLHIRPRVVGEFEDGALLGVFGQHGDGIFSGPTAIERDIASQYGVEVLGRTLDVPERFYAITVERKITHPAVVAISTAARGQLFG